MSLSISCSRNAFAEVRGGHGDDALQAVKTTSDAFAAIRGDGSVITWGSELDGGDSSLVTARLNTVVSIQATDCAFAAIRGDGTVVTWGSQLGGGDSSHVQDQLKNVVAIQASELAFAALLADGSVVTWGFYANGGDSSSVQEQLKHGVFGIQANKESFAAMRRDGTVVTWGGQKTSRDFRCIAVAASWWAFAAITEERRVVTWGEAAAGGDSTSVEDRLKDVLAISASERAFAALLFNGSVVTWGDADNGGDSSAVQDQLKHVRHISASGDAFAAILENGKVVTWGDPLEGGDSSAVREQLMSQVRDVQATCGAFAAIKEDGSVVTWGEETVGGDSSAVQDQLYSIEKVQAGLDPMDIDIISASSQATFHLGQAATRCFINIFIRGKLPRGSLANGLWRGGILGLKPLTLLLRKVPFEDESDEESDADDADAFLHFPSEAIRHIAAAVRARYGFSLDVYTGRACEIKSHAQAFLSQTYPERCIFENILDFVDDSAAEHMPDWFVHENVQSFPGDYLKEWSVKHQRPLEPLELMAAMGMPVTSELACAAGVPQTDVQHMSPSQMVDLAGNGMDAACVGFTLLSAFICLEKKVSQRKTQHKPVLLDSSSSECDAGDGQSMEILSSEEDD
ncbi:hypothetical protein AK812_SmicGene18041 [Symbiodinium microadriaticum]|uniref:E3 ubiquitin-protein ligase HERC2 n=1 Tax=Symbiodinium microadriaticum TaxID=2951 RepID=A0A1Q9DW62_SYMMI|nr:hypothetical protein AK812_SmicGene18041 [Symbiodinium microadriaticum]